MLKQRIITALMLIPLVLGALFFLPLKFFALLAALIFLLASREWGGFVATGSSQWLPLGFCLLLGASLLGLPVDQLWTPHLHPIVIGVLWCAVSWWLLGLLLVLRYPRSAELWRSSTWLKSLFGLVTLVPFFWSLVAIRGYNFYHDPMMGAWILLFVMGLVWAADSGAYFFGKAFGKRKLAPAVSPGKTIEGMCGGLFTASLLAIGVTWSMGFVPAKMFTVLFCSLLAVLASVLGDLTESMFKREAGIKDSGNLLPGHGGILDRIDSLTAALPVFLLSYLLLSQEL
ncbi:phosphatidate cytidylyltransferase [Aeromonas cavernicola]|uniref:Phosphatidate cytidylyltransferase n=1 Tax=Aeromonas cavernicola TaxID=1006623 RepID=A0A2H9U3D2_9GAMM|nr:phosphatidate cytidylyltransferase [Aeromonas cavernicola]PJG58530.1 phosphatidate cytidylyltransferase [Aeromonas cavernicola]